MVDVIEDEIHQNEGRKRDRKGSDSSETKSVNDINSPEAKKVRNEEHDEMETIDVIDGDLAIVYATRVLSKLEIETDNVDIRKLIDCYNPVLCGDVDMMKKHMLDTSDKWKDKEDRFKAAIMYILNDYKECEEKNVGDLAEILIAAIENRMPKFCKDCSLWYIVGRNDKPKMFCTWCKVGKHDCKQVTGIEEINGMKWFCKECNELFTEQIQPKMRKLKNIIFEGFIESDSRRKNLQNLLTGITKDKEEAEEEINNNDSVVEIVRKENNEDDKSKTTVEKDQEENATEDKKDEDKNNKTKKIETKKDCWFWLNRKCRFGDRCKDNHPTQCKKMMENGRCPDNRCKLAHPKVCRSLFNERYCSRRNCWYVHPTNIPNKYVFSDNNSYNNSNNNQVPNNNINNNDINQTGRGQVGMGMNNQWNQNNSNIGHCNTNNQPFLGQWPTPWEASKPMKMMIGKILEEMTTRIMNM